MSDLQQSPIGDEFFRQSSELLDQSIIKIRHCLAQLSISQIWWRPHPALNSIGNLILHIAGNLKQWGVVPLTNKADERNRDAEFSSDKPITADTLLQELHQVTSQAKLLWNQVASKRLVERFSIQGFDVSLLEAIMHTSSHFVGHTHQIILLTRMQLGEKYRFQWSPADKRGQLPI